MFEKLYFKILYTEWTTLSGNREGKRKGWMAGRERKMKIAGGESAVDLSCPCRSDGRLCVLCYLRVGAVRMNTETVYLF